MGNILSKIQQIASHEGITIGAMERSIGASKGVLSRAITNGTDIQSKWLLSIVENYPRYSAEWLLTGEGNMLKSGSPNVDEVTPKAKKAEKTAGKGENPTILTYMREQAAAHREELREKDTVIEQKNQEIRTLDRQLAQLEGQNQYLTAENRRLTQQNSRLEAELQHYRSTTFPPSGAHTPTPDTEQLSNVG